MVEIEAHPIGNNLKGEFTAFLEKSPLWTFDEYITQDMLIATPALYDGVTGCCQVCGEGLYHIFIHRNERRERVGVGIVCAANLKAIQEAKGDIDKVNFDRIVALEKRTMLKRVMEAQREQGMIQLEAKHHEEVMYVYEFYNLLQEVVAQAYASYPEKDRVYLLQQNYADLYRFHCEYLVSMYASIKHGKLSEAQLAGIQKGMLKGSASERIASLKSEKARTDARNEQERKSRLAIYRIERCLGETRRTFGGGWDFVFKPIWAQHREFLQSIREQFKQRQSLSDKQIDAVYEVHDKYCKEAHKEWGEVTA